MDKNYSLGERLQYLRKQMKMSQKDFATFIGIPQPSLSAYENSKNSPTIEVLVNIAKKCNISLDWLCGIQTHSNQFATLSDFGDFLYALLESEDLGIEFDIHDRVKGDWETPEDRVYTKLTLYANDKRYRANGEAQQLIKKVYNDYKELETYAISKDTYELAKEQTRLQYSEFPITKKAYPEMSYDELLKHRLEYVNNYFKNNNKK